MGETTPRIITVETSTSDAETSVRVSIELESPNRMQIETAIKRATRALLIATGGEDLPF